MARAHALFLALLAVLMLGVACKKAEEEAAAPPPNAKVNTVTIAVTDMVTPNCPVLVETAVSQMKGVKSVSASLESKSATIEYYEGMTSPDEILKVIKDQVGFNAIIAGT